MRNRKTGLHFSGRLLALLLSMVMLSGCEWSIPWQRPGTEPSVTPASTDYRPRFENKWCYRCLSPRMQEMYSTVYTAVMEYRTDTLVSIRGDVGESDYIGLKVKLPEALTDGEEARQLFIAFTADNPEFFFLGNTYSYEGYRLDDTDYYDVFCLTLTMDAARREECGAALETAVTEILEQLPARGTPYEKELFLHDLLAGRISYDDDTARSDAPAKVRPEAFTAYGALVEGQAVCEGYSRGMQLLLNRAGIPCTVVSGTADDGASHMWNVAEINGRRYHLDVTWDDAEDRLHHTFFNLTTEQMLLSHTPDRENLGVDTCTATEANYYLKEDRWLDTYSRSLIAEAVAKQVLTGASLVDLQFSEDTFANARLFFANGTRLKQYVAPFLEGETMWNYVCQANETYHTLTLYKDE